MVILKLYIKKLMTWFDYVYYRVYVAYQKRKDPDPWMYATTIVTLCPCLNFFIIDVIFEFFTGIYITDQLGKPIFVIILLAALGLNYRRYGYNKQSYYKFRARWKNESKKLRRTRGIWVLVYILASVLFPIVYGFIKHNIIGGKSFIHG